MTDTPDLIIVRQTFTPFGGAERFVARALDSLSAQGTRVAVLARRWRGEVAYPVIECRPFSLGRTWRDAGFARAACRLLEAYPDSLVQSHERIACCDLYRAGDGVHREWLRQRARLRGRGDWLARVTPYHRYVLAAERRMLASPRLKRVICNSRMVADELREWYRVPDERLTVIHSGVDTEVFHPERVAGQRDALRERLGFRDEEPMLLFVGSGYERKGLDSLLRALRRVPANMRLVVVGRDSQQRRWQRWAQRLGIASRVHFAGPRDDVTPWYAAADVFVLPTLYDPFPNVVLEAMACGLAVITSTKSGARDIIRQGENGYLCDALDIPVLRAHIETLGDAACRRRIGRAARETVAPMTLSRMAESYRQLYTELLER